MAASTSLFRLKERSILPGFGLSLGVSLVYLSLLVLIPLSALFFKTSQGGWEGFLKAAFSERALASYKITFGASFTAATINVFFGLIVAWVLTRYKFPGKKMVDALVDMPFALPTAVGGIALVTAYAPNGIIGAPLTAWVTKLGESALITKLSATNFGLWFASTDFAAFLRESGLSFSDFKAAYSPLGIVIAMTFISLPFVIRTVQPVIAELDRYLEEASATLGASRWLTFRRVLFPTLLPALLTGYALGFARALGEYGSVVFIAGNQPMKTEISPLLIITKLEEYDYPGATGIAVVMLLASFVLLLSINALQGWSRRRLHG
jgi:sulfate transport system permease protein